MSTAADRDELLTELRGVAISAECAVVEPTLPGTRNGGDLLVHLRFQHRSQWQSIAAEFSDILTRPTVKHVDGAQYEGNPQPTCHHAPGAIYRTLLLRVVPDTRDDTIARFEDDVRLLPRYVPAITGWQLSRIESAIGSSDWTHVFEQEFRSLEGLTGPYLMHPVHWAYVDRWFDPECPDAIVRERVCHSFCQCDSAVLTTDICA